MGDAENSKTPDGLQVREWAMFCATCGRALAGDAQFCPHCGRSLRTASRRPNDPMRGFGDGLAAELDRLNSRVEMAAAWIVPLALGLSPIEYDVLDELPGVVNQGDGQWEYRWNDRPVPSAADARRALDRVTEIVLRLRWNGSLSYPESPST